jgi:phage tail tape-measure protein
VSAVRSGTDSIRSELAELKESSRGVAASLRTAESAAGRLGVTGSAEVARLGVQQRQLVAQQKAVNAELAAASRAATTLGERSANVEKLTGASRALDGQLGAVRRDLEAARAAAAKFAADGAAGVVSLEAKEQALAATQKAVNAELAKATKAAKGLGGTSPDVERLTATSRGLDRELGGVRTELDAARAAAAKFSSEGSAGIAELAAKEAALKAQQKGVNSELAKASTELSKARRGAGDIDRLTKSSVELEKEVARVAHELEDAREAAHKLGVEGSADVAKLRREQEKLGDAVDKTQRKANFLKGWRELDVGGRTSAALRRIGSGLATVARQAALAGAAIGGIAIGAIGWFTKSAIDKASQMETLETALETVEGSAAKAQAAMGWIQKFGATTPYEIDEVGAAFNRLRAYGINPTDGTLRTLGDTAASMGKPLMSAVEAIADAVTGENERLKEFGIRAQKSGNQITYFYKNAAGEDVKKKVKANSQEMIRATLMAIWNEKYAGSMDKQSRTWRGLMSSLSDHWTLFQVRVMRSGVFDTLKTQLEGALSTANKWAEDGTLERWANELASGYRYAFDRVKEGVSWLRANWPEIKSALQSFGEGLVTVGRGARDVAGWLGENRWAVKSLGVAIAGLAAAKVLSPLFTIAKVGWDIVAWLSKATGLTGKLTGGLGGLKTPAAPGTPVAPKPGPGMLTAARGGIAAIGAKVGLGGTVAAAGAGTIAAVSVAGLAIGAAIGHGINKATEAATGATLSDHIARSLTSDVDEQRARLLAEQDKRPKRQPEPAARPKAEEPPPVRDPKPESVPPSVPRDAKPESVRFVPREVKVERRTEEPRDPKPESVRFVPREVKVERRTEEPRVVHDNRKIEVRVDARGNLSPDEVAERVARKLDERMRAEQGAAYGR